MISKLVLRLTSNKHTSAAGLAIIAFQAASKVSTIWFPQYAKQLHDTSEILCWAAASYAALLAGDSNPTPPKDLTATPPGVNPAVK